MQTTVFLRMEWIDDGYNGKRTLAAVVQDGDKTLYVFTSGWYGYRTDSYGNVSITH